MGTEQTVAQHYTHGALESAVLGALRAAGKDPDRLAPGDLAPVDEFHIGGRQATVAQDGLGKRRSGFGEVHRVLLQQERLLAEDE